MSQKRSPYRASWCLNGLGLFLITGFLFSCSRQKVETAGTDETEKGALSTPSVRGQEAAAFELPDLDGQTIRLHDFQGKVVLLNFWGTTCPPCKQEIPWLIEFQKQLGSERFQVVAVSMYGDGPEALKTYVAQHQMESLKVLIGNDDLAKAFGIAGFPTTFIVDEEGRYYARHDGLINRPGVEKELATLLGR